MPTNNKVLRISKKACMVPLFTLLIGGIIFIAYQNWATSSFEEHGGFFLLSSMFSVTIVLIIVITFTLLSMGAILGITSAITALRLSKEIQVSEKIKIKSYSVVGICISLIELGVLIFIML